ncbi:hypothetical protein HG531_004661 [Fusarium graminearum]|nr:hypothetical protein HG531_004661 [Fusarium graminearum]
MTGSRTPIPGDCLDISKDKPELIGYFIRQPLRLKDHTLGLLALLLLHLLDVDVPPNDDGKNTKRHGGNTGNGHESHSVSIRTNNGLTLKRTISKRLLDLNATENDASVGLGRLRKTLGQLDRHDIVPESTGDGITDTRTNTTEETRKSAGDGEVLMSDGGHDSDLVDGGENTSTETDEDLGQGQKTDVGVLFSEGNDQSGTQQHDGSTSHGGPLNVTSAGNEPSDTRRNDGRGERVGVENIVGVGDAQPVDNLEIRAEISVPAEGGQEHDGVEQA